jgi:hypothetical protein
MAVLPIRITGRLGVIGMSENRQIKTPLIWRFLAAELARHFFVVLNIPTAGISIAKRHFA